MLYALPLSVVLRNPPPSAAGGARPAPLAYVSPAQINFEVPAGTETGSATVMLQKGSSTQNLGTVRITAAAPALFSANASGSGVAAATAVRVVAPPNVQSPVPVFTCDQSGSCKAVPNIAPAAHLVGWKIARS